MRIPLAVSAVSAVAIPALLAAAALAPATARAAADQVRLPPAAAPGQTVMYGHVRSLVWRAGRWELRFDPALWLGGAAAERAAVEDGVLAPGEPVPNDYYVVDESRRALTFVVAAKARASIVTRGPGRAGDVTVAELAQLVRGRNPKRRPLFGPVRDFAKSFGFWIRIGAKYPSPVLSLDQQYQP